MSTRAKLLMCVTFGAAIAAPVLGSDGRIPVYQVSTIISQPGSYYVTQNLAGTGSTPVIYVQSPGVDLDLNGFTLSQAAGPAAVVLVDPVDRFRIHGGSLSGGNRSINWATGGGYTTTVEDITMIAPAAEGIRMTFGSGTIIRRVQIVGSGGDGIALVGTNNATVEDSVIHAPGGVGIHFTDVQASKALRNTVKNAQGNGITVDGQADVCSGVLLHENLIAGPVGEGIRIASTSGGEIWNNHIDRTGMTGIHILSTALYISVRGNHVVSNAQDGVRVEGSINSIVGNQLANNLYYGLRFTSTATLNTYGTNSIASDGGSIGCTGTAVALDFCNEGTANGSFGDNLVPTQPLF